MRQIFFVFLLISFSSFFSEQLHCQTATLSSVSDTTFVRLSDYDTGFLYDMKYASDDNFLKAQVYDCAVCYLRFKTAKALIVARTEASKLGYCIKLFDCYRPLDVQKKMWDIFPNPRYVANPKTGSIHNRGGAVDLTLTDSLGRELDMGTNFDDFSKKAAHDFVRLPKKVRNNRAMLRDIMESAGFKALNSEWWHYNLFNSANDDLSNSTWECN